MSDWKRAVRLVLISTSSQVSVRQCELCDIVASILTILNSGDFRMVILRSLLLMLFAVSTLVGCGGDASTGHVEDKTPGGEATPPLMDDTQMDAYSAEQGAKASEGQP